MADWKNFKINASILLPQLIGGPAVAVGSIYTAERFAPHQMEWLKKIVANNIVLPHLKFFESLGGGLRQAHEKYNEKKHAERLAAGKKDKPDEPDSPQERAAGIADALVTSSVALTADLAATIGLQALMGKLTKSGIRPVRAAMVESSVQLVLTATMLAPGIARVSENINHGIRKRLQRNFNMDTGHAEDISVPLTYISIPGLLASLASLYNEHKKVR